MQRILASEFSANCFENMDDVARSGDAAVITKKGKAIGKLVPYREPRQSLLGLHANQCVVLGDLIAPLDATWNVDNTLAAPQEPDDRIASYQWWEHPFR